MADEQDPKHIKHEFRGSEPKIETGANSPPFQRDAREKTGDQLPETNVRRNDAQVVAPVQNPLGAADAKVVAPYNPDPLIEAKTREREQQEKARLAANQGEQEQAQQ